MAKRKRYWFRVSFGKWTDDEFDSESGTVFVEAWDAHSACRKAMKKIEMDDGEIITAVEFLGYPQV